MVRGLLIFSFLGLAYLLSAQTRDIENLKAALESEWRDQQRADLYYQLGEQQYNFNFEQGLQSVTRSLVISREISYWLGEARALTSIGKYYYFIGDHAKAFDNYRKALRVPITDSLSAYPTDTHIRLSIIHRIEGRLDSARWYLDRAEQLLQNKPTGSQHASFFATHALLLHEEGRSREALTYLRKSGTIRLNADDPVFKSIAYRNMGFIHNYLSQYDSALWFYQQSLDIGKAQNDPEQLSLTLLYRGHTWFLLGDFKKALSDYTAAAGYMRNNTYLRYYALLLYRLGEYYGQQSDFYTAFDYLFKALSEFERIGARADIARTYNQIAWCYTYQRNYKAAQTNLNRAYEVAREISYPLLLAANDNLQGNIYYESGNPRAALTYLLAALQTRKAYEQWWGVSSSLYNAALCYASLEKTDSAALFFSEATAIDEKIGKKSGRVFTSNRLGLYYTEQGNYAMAKRYLDEANRIAKQISLPLQLLTNYRNYIRLYESQGQTNLANQYYRRYVHLRDSLELVQVQGKVAEADAMHQLNEKIREVAAVNEQYRLIQAQMEGQERELISQRKLVIIYSVAIVFLALLSTVIAVLWRKNKRARKALEVQNLEILEQKEEIESQAEELIEYNQQLIALNEELDTKNEEVEAQAQTIATANTLLEQRIEERTERLNKAYQELETFFYRTSHDFRRPLTTLMGLSQLAKSAVKDPMSLDLFQKVRETTLNLDRMLAKLQHISSVEHHSDLGEVGISSLIDSCTRQLYTRLNEKEIAVERDIGCSSVISNKFLLGVALFNLMENAIDFCAPVAPYVKITTLRTNEGFVLRVEDNGHGIRAELMDRIFEMYYRASEYSRGNGLGLYVTKRAVEKLGGRIRVTSELGKGSVFELVLPVQPEP